MNVLFEPTGLNSSCYSHTWIRATAMLKLLYSYVYCIFWIVCPVYIVLSFVFNLPETLSFNAKSFKYIFNLKIHTTTTMTVTNNIPGITFRALW